jgi:hypothetical protein
MGSKTDATRGEWDFGIAWRLHCRVIDLRDVIDVEPEIVTALF